VGRKLSILALMVEYVNDMDAVHFEKMRDLGFNLGDDGADDTSDCDRDGNVRVRLEEAIGGRPPALTTKWGGQAETVSRWSGALLTFSLAAGATPDHPGG